MDRQRLSRRLPGHPADLLVPRRVEHRDAVPRLPPDARLLPRPVEVGARRAWTPTQMADVQGHVSIVNSEVSDAAQFHVAVPTDPCAGDHRCGALRPADQPGRRALHDPGRGDQRLRPAPGGGLGAAGAGARSRLRRAADRQRRRAVRARARSPGEDHAGAVRRPQREDRRHRHRHQPDRRPDHGDQAGAGQRLPQRHDQRDQQPRPDRDHRLPRARPGPVPRRLPRVRRAGAARPRARHPRQPADLGGAGGAHRRRAVRAEQLHRDGPLARRGRAGPPAAAGAEDRRRQARRPHRPLLRRHRQQGLGRPLPGRGGPTSTARRGRSPATRSRPTPTSASSSRSTARRLRPSSSRTPSGRRSQADLPRRRLRLLASPAWTSRGRSHGRPTRTARRQTSSTAASRWVRRRGRRRSARSRRLDLRALLPEQRRGELPGSNGRRSSTASPTPISFTGSPRSFAIASAIPPLAVPSSFVSTTPDRSTESANTCAWRRPFWPVVASITISVSCGAPSSRLAINASGWRTGTHTD